MDIQTRGNVPIQKRTNWNLTWDKFFVDLMVDQVMRGKKVEKGFRKDSWHYMVSEFNKKFHQKLNHRHLKNRYCYFKREYNIVQTLLDQSGFGWDVQRSIVTAEDGVWDRYILEHPEAKPYRMKGLPLYESFSIIYEKATANGQGLFSSHCEVPPKEVVGRTRVEQPGIFVEHLNAQNFVNEESTDSSKNENNQPNKRQSASSTSSHRGKKGRKGTDDSIAKALHEIAASMNMRASLMMRTEEKLKKCIEELLMMEGVDDDLCIDACNMLKEEKNAIIFLKLEGELRLGWLKKTIRQMNAGNVNV